MFYIICHISIFIFKVTICDLKRLFYGYLDGVICNPPITNEPEPITGDCKSPGTKRLGHFLTTDYKSVETPNGKKPPYLQQAVLAANASIQLIYREYQIPILSPYDIAELYLELLEFVFIQV